MRFFLALIVFLTTIFSVPPARAQDDGAESVYDRVMRTGTIRCGYLAWKDFIDIDPNTGAMTGIIHDYMDALSRNLGLKLEWAAEVGRGDYVAGLDSGRFDVYCTAMAINAERARVSDFTRPILYTTFNLYVRDGDTRFDRNLAALDTPDMKFVSIEGDIFGKITRLDFPKATLAELPQLSGDTDPFLSVAQGKADVVIGNANIGARFMQQNPGKIRTVVLDKPFRYFPGSLAVKADEYRFRQMLDLATEEILFNGTMDKILDRYDPDRAFFFRTATPYALPR